MVFQFGTEVQNTMSRLCRQRRTRIQRVIKLLQSFPYTIRAAETCPQTIQTISVILNGSNYLFGIFPPQLIACYVIYQDANASSALHPRKSGTFVRMPNPVIPVSISQSFLIHLSSKPCCPRIHWPYPCRLPKPAGMRLVELGCVWGQVAKSGSGTLT